MKRELKVYGYIDKQTIMHSVALVDTFDSNEELNDFLSEVLQVRIGRIYYIRTEWVGG